MTLTVAAQLDNCRKMVSCDCLARGVCESKLLRELCVELEEWEGLISKIIIQLESPKWLIVAACLIIFIKEEVQRVNKSSSFI